jgi:hypothetical protein
MPAQRRSSVRRSAVVDMVRLHGRLLPMTVAGRARDVVTEPNGGATVVDEATFDMVVDEHVRVSSFTSTPPERGVSGLVGCKATSGFRRAVDDLLPDPSERRSPLYRLLFDVPMAVLVPGYALEFEGGRDRPVRTRRIDVCAGWRAKGIFASSVGVGRPIPVAPGPAVMSPVFASDDLGWPALPRLVPGAMRRYRRLDVWSKDRLVADAWFHDTFVDATGAERMVHQYHLRAGIDPCDLTVVDLQVDPGFLPSVDCGAAAASAEAARGELVESLAGAVRASCPTSSTCTHLNDFLSTLADVPALAGWLGDALS